MRHIGTSNEAPERISWIIKKLKVDGLLKRWAFFTLFSIYLQLHMPKEINLISVQV
jgi:hypothetical protein